MEQVEGNVVYSQVIECNDKKYQFRSQTVWIENLKCSGIYKQCGFRRLLNLFALSILSAEKGVL